MLASHNWLMQLCGLERSPLAPADVAKRLTAAGLEVESLRAWGQSLQQVVVAEVRGLRPHPSREKLRLVTVFDGEREQEVVCGAPNVPAPGGLVVFARLGASLPNGMRIEERKLGGVVSCGMICSDKELDLGADEDGILIVDPAEGRVPGAPIASALGLVDTIYEIGLTPNRPDCLGHVGLARELCVLLDRPFALPAPAAIERVHAAKAGALLPLASAFSLATGAAATAPIPADLPPVQVHVSAPARCPRYGAALVTGVHIGPSPFWARYRLHTLGLRAISNVVDATNLVMLGFGHPIHAFDLHKLRGARIDVRLARAGETMHTLDGQARTLAADDLLICDGQGPVALAGVMGGANSEISPQTQHVLIECAYFEPRGVRRTSKRLGLHTDSSHRFERGVDPEAVRSVLAYASALIAQLSAGSVVADAVDVYPHALPARSVSYRPARALQLLGLPAGASERTAHAQHARAVFERLGCQLSVSGETLAVRLPTFRPDLGREVDLIEEWARITGYDTIPTALPHLRASDTGSAPEIGFVRRLREAGVAAGLCEAVNFAFVAPPDLAKARVSVDAPRVANPMTEDRSVLRTALLPGLLANLRNAQRQAQRSFGVFEVARVFATQPGDILPAERYELGVLLWGLRHSWYDERDLVDFYDGKGVVNSLVQAVNGRELDTVLDPSLDTRAAFLHPRRRATLAIAGQTIGCLGELHPDVLAAFELEGRPVYASLDVAALLAIALPAGFKRAQPLPRFPAATRDIAVVVAEALPVGEVGAVLKEVAGELAESVRLFDIYRGAPVPAGHKSLAFHVVYRDPTATLTDKLVDEAHARATTAAQERLGALVRK